MTLTLSMNARRATSAPSGSGLSRAVRWVVRLLCATFMLGVAALLAVGVAVPRMAGATPYVILTSSMRPTLPPGTLVISRPVDPADIGIGDVITYQLRSGEPEVVTHRVITVSFTTGGEYVFTTKGDANDLPDQAPVRAVQVRGKSWYAVPYLGRATSLLDPHARRLIGWAVGGALLAQGTWWLAEAFLTRRRRGPS
jgi:signal peptidase I